MKGRMFVVNSETIEKTKNENIVSVISPNFQNKMWVKTLSDIMADILQVEIGDYIFLWETSKKGNKSRIHGVYRAISKPYYECISEEDNAPFKIKIEKAYDFKEPIFEYDVLNNPYIKNEMWTIIGKKVGGKSRGTSPLSPNEIKNLITLLIDKNKEYVFYDYNPKNIKNVPNPLKIDYSNKGNPVKPKSLKFLNPNYINFLENNNIRYEKVLEAILNQEIINKNSNLFLKLGIDLDKVIWYSNYLPYSIEQSEMDYVIFQSDDGMCINKIFVIELQKNKVDKDHIQRCLIYSKWINETIAIGANVVQPILICFDSYDFINEENNKNSNKKKMEELNLFINNTVEEYKVKYLQIYKYSFKPDFTFERKR